MIIIITMNKKTIFSGLIGFVIGVVFWTPFVLFRTTDKKEKLLRDVETQRVTAIVKAANEVSESVVSITVLATRLVEDRFFSPFFDDFFRDLFPPRYYKEKIRGLGSGVIVSEDGYIITNAHVVEGAEVIKVTLPNGKTYDAKLVGIDNAIDLALLKIDAHGLHTVKLGNSDELLIGEWVIALGNPFGFLLEDSKPSVTVGVISALKRNIRVEGRYHYRNMIQTDAAINPGNSGGPLVNVLGEVIGINTFIFTKGGGSEGVGFAIPSNTVKKFIKEVKKHKKRRPAWLGIGVQDISADIAEALNFTTPQGVIIVDVFKDSPAEDKGLEPGDVIIFANGDKISSKKAWEDFIANLFVDDTVRMKVVRSKDTFEVTLVASEYKEEKGVFIPSLKIWVKDLNPVLSYKYQIHSREGAFVYKVENGYGKFIGLRPGDVILYFQQKKIRKAEDLKKYATHLSSPLDLIIEREGATLHLFYGF